VPAVDSAQQDALLRERISGDIYERSAFHRGRLDRAGLGKNGVRHLRDLARLPPMILEDVRSPGDLLLHAGAQAMTTGGRKADRHWPLQWVRSGGVPLGYSARDLTLLGDLGRRLLESGGITRTDVLANLIAPGASRDFWQLALGAQRAGVSAVSTGPGADVGDLDIFSPTVLAGEAKELIRVLDSAAVLEVLQRVHTVISVGQLPTERQSEKLAERIAANSGAVLRAWAPDGVLALWGQCRGGSGLHTWPQAELLEVVDPLTGLATPTGRPGQLLWTGTGWYGSAIVRFDTATFVAAVPGQCPSCGRMSLRIEPVESAPGVAGFLDDSEQVKGWRAELRRMPAGDELVIWVVPEDPMHGLALLEAIDAAVGSARVILIEHDELERGLLETHQEKFGDRRALPHET